MDIWLESHLLGGGGQLADDSCWHQALLGPIVVSLLAVTLGLTYIILRLGLLPSASMVSPLNLWQFSAEIRFHPDRGKVNYVLHGIARGFDIGFSAQSPLTSARKNEALAYEHPEVVDAYLRNEVSLGRVSGHFDFSPLPDFHISEFGIIPKAG